MRHFSISIRPRSISAALSSIASSPASRDCAVSLKGLPVRPAACINGLGPISSASSFPALVECRISVLPVKSSRRITKRSPASTRIVTWVKGAHTFKFGAELYLDQILTGAYSGVTLAAQGAFGTPDAGIAAATAQPYVPSNSFNGYNMGFGFASFLLGDYTFANAIGANRPEPAEFYRQGYQQWGLFAQDSWKVRRNLTITYGARWDYATPYQEQYGRLGQLNGTLPNPSAGGAPGAIQYASNCNCNFYKSAYPFAIGPRVGVAYQITPKTVFAAGGASPISTSAMPRAPSLPFPASILSPVSIRTSILLRQGRLSHRLGRPPIPALIRSPVPWALQLATLFRMATKTGRRASTSSALASSKRLPRISSCKPPS